MSNKYVKLEDVYEILRNSRNLGETHISYTSVFSQIKNLPTHTIDEGFKVGDEVWGINDYCEIVFGFLSSRDKRWDNVKAHLVCDEDVSHDCNNIYKTRLEAEQALKEREQEND